MKGLILIERGIIPRDDLRQCAEETRGGERKYQNISRFNERNGDRQQAKFACVAGISSEILKKPASRVYFRLISGLNVAIFTKQNSNFRRPKLARPPF